MPSRLTLLSKLFFDGLLAGAALLCLGPVFALVAAAIKIGDGGSVFFRQTRTGLHGRPFQILKFRTMVPHDGRGAKVTVGGDNRVTKIGAFLRKTKLDELPQLINVLKGEMSLIGPRPEVAEYTDKYSTLDRQTVLAVRPGISDFASIRFRNESELLAAQSEPLGYYEKTLLPRKLRYARFYVRHAGVLMDLKLIVWTLLAIAGWVPVPFRTGQERREAQSDVKLVSLALLVGGAVYYALFLRHGLLVDDEGYLLLGANEVLRGLWPLADFQSYGPLSYWLLALFFKVFGNCVMAERWMLLGLLLLNAQAVLWIARRLLPLRWAFVIAAFYALAPGSWCKLFFISAVLLISFALLLWMEKPDIRRSIFLGLSLGVAVLLRPETGLIGGGLIGCAYAIHMIFLKHRATSGLRVTLPATTVLGVSSLFLPALTIGAYASVGKLQAAIQMLGSIYLEPNSTTTMAQMGLLAPFSLTSLWAWPVPLEQAFYAAGLLSCLGGICVFACRLLSKHGKKLSASMGLLIGGAALGTLAYSFPFVFGTRMLSTFPLVYICFGFLLWRGAACFGKARHRKALIVAGFVALSLCIVTFSKHQIYSGSLTTRLAPTVAIDHPKLRGLYPYQANQEDIEALQRHLAQAPKGATLVSMSESTTMGYLSGLPNPTLYRAFSVEFAKEGEQERAIATFDRLKITYFVGRKRQFMNEGGPASDLDSYAPLIKAYLLKHYRLIPLGRNFVLLQRNEL